MNSKIKDKYTALHNTRFLWLKNPGGLSGKQQARLEELSQLEFLDTVKAYWLRLRVQEFYESHKAYDWSLLIDYEALALEVCNSEIVEKKKFGELFTRNGEEILNYFLTFRTNAILEGFNSKITKGEDFDKICLIRDAKLIATINCNDEYVLLNDLPDETETSKDINKLIIVKLKKEDIIFSVDDALYVVSFAD